MLRRLHTVALASVIALVAIGSIAMLAPGTAHAAPSATADSPSGTQCRTWRVHLRGELPPEVACKAAPTPTGSSLWPDTLSRSCYGSDLHLYVDINRGGDVICFWGTGFVNLSDYWHIWPVQTWDNIVSSWYSGVWHGTLYQYPNGGAMR